MLGLLFHVYILCFISDTFSMAFQIQYQIHSSHTSVYKKVNTNDCPRGLRIGRLLLSRGKFDCARRCSLLEGCKAFDYKEYNSLCGLMTSSESDSRQTGTVHENIYKNGVIYIDIEQIETCRGEDKSKNISSTSPTQESTTSQQTTKIPIRECQIDAGLMNDDTGEFWLFGKGWIYKYSDIAELSSGPKTRVPIQEEFPDSTEPITSAYYEKGIFYLINDEIVYSYDKPQTTFVRKSSIYSHFRSDIPRRIEAILAPGSGKQIFTKLNVFYMTDNTIQMHVIQFKSDSNKNPYYTEVPSVRPDYVMAAVAINSKTFLFFYGNNYFLFKNDRMYRKWTEKGKIVC